MHATIQKLTKTYSQVAFDKFVAQQVKSMNKMRAKCHRDWKDATDEQIKGTAEAMARIYDAGTVWA